MSTDDTRKLPEGFEVIMARLDSFEQNMTAQVDSFEQTVRERMDSFDQRLASLEEKADRQAMETKPIWEKALAEIVETREEMGKGFRNIERRLNVVSADINQMRADIADLEDRIGQPDQQPS